MTGKNLKQKVLGGVLALGMIAAIGMGSSSTASAAGFHGRRVVIVERGPVFVPRPYFGWRAGFYGPRFYARRCR
jgi:hypothetical protein